MGEDGQRWPKVALVEEHVHRALVHELEILEMGITEKKLGDSRMLTRSILGRFE